MLRLTRQITGRPPRVGDFMRTEGASRLYEVTYFNPNTGETRYKQVGTHKGGEIIPAKRVWEQTGWLSHHSLDGGRVIVYNRKVKRWSQDRAEWYCKYLQKLHSRNWGEGHHEHTEWCQEHTWESLCGPKYLVELYPEGMPC